MAYFFVIIYIIILSLWINKVEAKKKIIKFKGTKKKIVLSTDFCFLLLVLAPMAYMAVNRSYLVGSDTAGVYKLIYYEGYAVNNWKSTVYEGGFIQYVKILYRIFHEFDALLLISFLLIAIAFVPFLLKKRKKISICISLLIFFTWIFCPYLNVLRQILAVAISFCGLNYLEKGKIKKAIVIWIIAIFVHVTAIAMFLYLIPYFYRNSVNKNKIPLIFLLSPLALLFVSNVIVKIPIFSKFASKIAVFGLENLNTKFFFLPVLVLPFIVIYWKKLLLLDEFNYMHLCGYLLIFLSVLLSGFLWYAFRMMYYFVPSMMIIVGQLGNCCSDRKQKYIVNSYLIIAIIISFILVYVLNNTDGIYPFIWR